jgi:hypothetical protein
MKEQKLKKAKSREDYKQIKIQVQQCCIDTKVYSFESKREERKYFKECI